MKSVLKTVRNYFCYCGIEKDEYNALKKDAYISNFEVWQILHVLMAVVFAFLYISSLFNSLMQENRLFYLLALIYSVIAVIKAINFISGFVKRKKPVAVHSMMNKITGLLLFVLPLTLGFIELKYSAAVVCAVAAIAAVQEGYYIRTGRSG